MNPRKLFAFLTLGILIFVWQYVVISNFGIVEQPWNARHAGFSYMKLSRPMAGLVGPTVRIAWFPACTLLAYSYGYPTGSRHWTVSVRQSAFRLGLVPPEDASSNGLPLALINTSLWLLGIAGIRVLLIRIWKRRSRDGDR